MLWVKKKAWIYVLLLLLVIVLVIPLGSHYLKVKKEKKALQEKLNYYTEIIKSEQKWLASLEQANGALAFAEGVEEEVKIIPYFSCIAILALLERVPALEYQETVKNYLDWHFTHLNEAREDVSGIPGTIYDYYIGIGKDGGLWERTAREYDSTDSYGALFLLTLWKYYEQTEDGKYLLSHYEEIRAVIGAMNATLDKDGLTYAKPTYKIKYLMDNVEVWQGLGAALNIFEQVFLPAYNEKTLEYKAIKEMIVDLKEQRSKQGEAISILLWNEEEQRYETGIDNDDNILEFKSWMKFYPDAVAQLFPIIFGVIDADSERARNLYNKFGEHFSWENMSHFETGATEFYWSLLAYCGALMNDEQKVRLYLDNYMTKVRPVHKYPAYNADAAWVVLASAKMAAFYQEEIAKIDPLGIVYVRQSVKQ